MSNKKTEAYMLALQSELNESKCLFTRNTPIQDNKKATQQLGINLDKILELARKNNPNTKRKK